MRYSFGMGRGARGDPAALRASPGQWALRVAPAFAHLPYAWVSAQAAAVDRALAATSDAALRTHEDGWSVGEILAHTAHLAEIFAELLLPGSYPEAQTFAVRRADGRIDLDASNERARAARGDDPAKLSLARLARVLALFAAQPETSGEHWAERLIAHTQEHLGEVEALFGDEAVRRG